MISILDRGVGAVVEALRSNELLDDTLIVFFSDNGGANNGFASTEASNYPLRGVSIYLITVIILCFKPTAV